MIRDLSEKKQQNEFVEEEILRYKEAYCKPQMSDEQIEALRKKMEEADMATKIERRKAIMTKFAVTSAAIIAVFMILPNTSATVAHAMGKIPVIGELVKVVTFRDYKYEGERNMADIEVPEIVLEEQVEDSEIKETLSKTTDEINAEIKKITDELVANFEENLESKQGYQDVIVKSEVLATTSDYFTLNLICYQGAGSGYQWNYYYTIDLQTGERLKLKDIFKEGADYITPISENIKEQMQEQMEADEMVYYWLNDEIEEWNFKSITEETSFYLNQNDNVVISFDEGEVAPMYMGTVEFEIPSDVLLGLRK